MRSEEEIRAALEMLTCLGGPEGANLEALGSVRAIRWVLNDPPPEQHDFTELYDLKQEVQAKTRELKEANEAIEVVKAQRDTISRQLAEARQK